MKQNFWRGLFSAGALAAAGAMALGPGLANAEAAPRYSTDAYLAPAYVPPSHDLFFGAKGAAVKSVERLLNQLHYYAGPVDGVFGQDLEWADAQNLAVRLSRGHHRGANADSARASPSYQRVTQT